MRARFLKFSPSVVIKGDYVGHPFRGNQWTNASGASAGEFGSAPTEPTDNRAVGDLLQPTSDIAEAIATGRPYVGLDSYAFPPEIQNAIQTMQTLSEQDGFVAAELAVLGRKHGLEHSYVRQNGLTKEQIETKVKTVISESFVAFEVAKHVAEQLGLVVVPLTGLNPSDSGLKTEQFTFDRQYRNEDGRLMHEDTQFYNIYKPPMGYGEITNLNGGSLWFTEESGYTEPRYGKPMPTDRNIAWQLEDDIKEVKAGTASPDVAARVNWYQNLTRQVGVPDSVQDYRLGFDVQATMAKTGLSRDEVGELIRTVQSTANKLTRNLTIGLNGDGSDRFANEPQMNDSEISAYQAETTKDAYVSITLPSKRLGSLLKEGRYKTQFETGTSGGYNVPKVRSDFEALAFGIHPNTDPSKRPVYGMVESGGLKLPVDRSNDQYGNVILVLKKDVNARTSFTDGDSLNLTARHAPLNAPASRRVLRYRRNDKSRVYYEAQVRGGVSMSDVAKIIIAGKQDALPAATLKALIKSGIPYQFAETTAEITEPVAKGDYVGHPFRGNQWSNASGQITTGGSSQAIPNNDLNFNPFGAEAKTYSETDRRDERIEFSMNAAVAFGDVRRADIMRLHQLRGVGVVEIDTPTDRFNPKRYINVVRLGGYDTSMILMKSPQHQTREAAERAKPKVQAALEKFFANPTLKAKPIDKDIWEYEWVIPEGEPMAGRTATRRVSFVKPQYPDQPADVIKFAPSFVIKGDFVGHPFRGNQWSDASGGSTGSMSSASPATPDLSGVSAQIDTLLQENDAAGALRDEFIKDHWGEFMNSIEKLGYKRTERSVVVVDGKEINMNYGGWSDLPADHPIRVLHDKYEQESTNRRNEHFTATDSLIYGSFDIADGLSVYDKARQIVLAKVAEGIYYHDGADNTRMALEFDVRDDVDRKAMVRYVVDDGCTGPTGIGKGATGVNDAIRQGKNPAFAKQIDRTMLISNRPIAVYRGASLPQRLLDSMTVGSSYTERGFMSTAPQRHTAEFYAKERHGDKLAGPDARIVIFRMLLPKGTKANPMNYDEIVVARNSTIRVASKQDVTDPELGPITVIDAVVEQ